MVCLLFAFQAHALSWLMYWSIRALFALPLLISEEAVKDSSGRARSIMTKPDANQIKKSIMY